MACLDLSLHRFLFPSYPECICPRVLSILFALRLEINEKIGVSSGTGSREAE